MFDTPETAEGEVIVKEKMNVKFLYVLGGVVVIIIGALLVMQMSGGSSNSAGTQIQEDVQVISVVGNVTSINSEKNEVAVTLSENSDGLIKDNSREGEDVVVKINTSTVVQTLVISRGDDGLINRSGVITMNVSDIEEGDKVSVEYIGLNEDLVLNKVKNISILTESGDFEKTYHEESNKVVKASFSGILGQIETIDIGLSTITYRSYGMGQLGDKISTATLLPESVIYSVASTDLVHIKHARSEMSWEDIEIYDKVLVVVNDDVDFSQQSIAAQSIIIIKGE